MKKLLQTLQSLTGMGFVIYDAQFRCVAFTVAEPATESAFCSVLHRSQHCLARCQQSDTAALEYVRDHKTPYLYQCPFGLLEAVFPIMEQEKLHGYLQISHALPNDPQDATDPVATALQVAPTLSADALCAGRDKLRRYTPEELEAIYHTVSIFAEHIASNHMLSASGHPLGELIKQYVRKNLGNKITLTGMSRNLHCSTVTLTETFRREYGITIMQYVLKKRMKMAEGLLADPNTALSVTEIADRCGFPDMEYFSKRFKETHNVSPTAWRRMHAQKTE